MKASELRQNNYINRKYLNPTPNGLKKEYENCIVKAIGIENIIVEIKDKSYLKGGFENFYPILLTEEWLIKFGLQLPLNTDDYIYDFGNYEYKDTFSQFIKLSQSCIDAYYYLEGIRFYLDSNGFWFPIMDIHTNIKYVHELQNLYFALTGNELTINN